MNKQERKDNLMPNNKPRYIRCYDNQGKSFDRYTVLFTGHYKQRTGGVFLYSAMSENPFHPQGFGQHGESLELIDSPKHAHLGKKINFDDLPDDSKKLVVSDYMDLWEL